MTTKARKFVILPSSFHFEWNISRCACMKNRVQDSMICDLRSGHSNWRIMWTVYDEASRLVPDDTVQLIHMVIYTVLLYGSEIWVVTGVMLMVLEGFYHRLARKIVGNKAQHTGDWGWEWPPLEEALEVAGICPTK